MTLHELADRDRRSVSPPARRADRDERARGVRAAARGALGRRRSAPRNRIASSPTGWRVNTWVKQGILLGFRFGDIVDVSMDHGRWPFYDKDTLPLKRFGRRRRRAHRAGRIVGARRRLPRAGRDLHAADVREHRRLGRRRLAHRLARAGRLVRAGRRARPHQRRRADRRRHRAGRRAAGHHRGRRARRRQHRDLRRRDHQGARGRRRRHRADRIDAGLRSRARRDHQADRRPAARHSRRRGRRAGRARRHRRARGPSGDCRSRRRSS